MKKMTSVQAKQTKGGLAPIVIVAYAAWGANALAWARAYYLTR